VQNCELRYETFFSKMAEVGLYCTGVVSVSITLKITGMDRAESPNVPQRLLFGWIQPEALNGSR
jgi:hypothetical protein